MLTVEEAAAELNVSAYTIREWAKKGTIPAHRYGRLWRFDKNEITSAGKISECPSIDTPSPLIGGYASRSAVEKFAKRQEQKTASKPKNTSTSSEPNTGDRLSSASSTTHGKKRATDG